MASIFSLAAGTGLGIAISEDHNDTTGRTDRTAGQAPREDTPRPSQAFPGVAPNVGDDALEVGEPRVGSAVTTTVLEVKDDYRDGHYRPPANDSFGSARWLGVNVKMCITGDLGDQTAPIGWSLFEAGTTEGATYPASGSSWSDFPSPQFPTYGELRSGCRQGWLLIPVPANEPANVIRLNSDLGIGETVAEWTF